MNCHLPSLISCCNLHPLLHTHSISFVALSTLISFVNFIPVCKVFRDYFVALRSPFLFYFNHPQFIFCIHIPFQLLHSLDFFVAFTGLIPFTNTTLLPSLMATSYLSLMSACYMERLRFTQEFCCKVQSWQNTGFLQIVWRYWKWKLLRNFSPTSTQKEFKTLSNSRYWGKASKRKKILLWRVVLLSKAVQGTYPIALEYFSGWKLLERVSTWVKVADYFEE